MKKVFHKTLCLIIGIAVAICLSLLFHHSFSRQTIVQKDTVEVIKTVRYHAADLETIRLDIPDVTIPEFIFIAEEKTRIEYRDSIRYVVLSREFFFTETKDVRIWHSGVESRIDSIEVTQKNIMIQEVRSDKPIRHSLTAYGELGYLDGIKATAGVKYLYHPNAWLGLGGSIERDFIAKHIGIFANIDMTIGW